MGMKLSVIVALARNGVIGRDGGLPWHLPADLLRFRAITMGKPIVMGRRTHVSIGRVLPGRRNVVLSRDTTFTAPGCEVFASLDSALAALADQAETMIIGGAALYTEALPRAARLHVTEVDAEIAGDVYFPALDRSQWHEVACEKHPADGANPYAYCFRVLDRLNRN
jgi:dihydrofolate reductase